jgi:nitroreductase
MMRVNMAKPPLPDLQSLLDARYSDAPHIPALDGLSRLPRSMAARGACRIFQDRPVPLDLLETLSAIALASPTKSDLQQRDIVFLVAKSSRQRIASLVSGQAWVADAPVIAVFCGNNRRQRLLHEWRGIPFANDHQDAFFNAAVDAGIALGAYVTAAESMGLGCCPISAVRNKAAAVSDFLGLPDHVFPVAGLALGYPTTEPAISMRLPLGHTVHIERYDENGLREAVAAYDHDRSVSQPYSTQRDVQTFGTSAAYCWSEDKVRQYSRAERETFGNFVRAKGFSLD